MKKKNPWFDYALDDFKGIRVLLNEKVYRLVCFHAQQFVEKVFKGLLFQQGMDPPRTQDLGFLYQKLGQLNAPLRIDVADLEFLSGVYVEFRYPPEIGFLSHGEPRQEDAEKASAIAGRVFAQVEKLLEGK
ncbi:MAG: HEPN domain-containing protein [Anaerolineae bacterium]